MRTLIASALLAVLATGCTEARLRDTLAAYDAVAVTCDVSETLQFGDMGKWDRALPGTRQAVEEGNPVLGANPPAWLTLTDLAVSLVSVYVAHHYDNKMSTAYLAGFGVVETAVNVSNMRMASPCGIGPTPLVKTEAVPTLH